MSCFQTFSKHWLASLVLTDCGYDDFERYARPYNPRHTSDELLTTVLKISFSPSTTVFNKFLLYGHFFPTKHPTFLIFIMQSFALKPTAVLGKSRSCSSWGRDAAVLSHPGRRRVILFFSVCHISIFLLVIKRQYIVFSPSFLLNVGKGNLYCLWDLKRCVIIILKKCLQKLL